jgi:hypothetical protein
MHQQPPKIWVATFADPEEFCFPTGTQLPRDQADPRCKVSTSAKLLSIADGADECGCRDNANAGNGE